MPPAPCHEEVLAYLHHHGARVEYDPTFIRPHDADHIYQNLLASLEFNTEEASKVRRPFSRDTIAIPRRQTGYGDPGTAYTFAGCTVPARPWIPVLVALRTLLSTRVGADPNFVLVNLRLGAVVWDRAAGCPD